MTPGSLRPKAVSKPKERARSETASLGGAVGAPVEVLDEQAAAGPQRVGQLGQHRLALRQVAQQQPGVRGVETAAGQVLGHDVLLDDPDVGVVLGQRQDEPGVDVDGQDLSAEADGLGGPADEAAAARAGDQHPAAAADAERGEVPLAARVVGRLDGGQPPPLPFVGVGEHVFGC
jgi:hypothetical protein